MQKTVNSPTGEFESRRIKQIGSDVLGGRDYSSTILHLDALAAAINFGISFNFDGDSFRKALEIVAW